MALFAVGSSSLVLPYHVGLCITKAPVTVTAQDPLLSAAPAVTQKIGPQVWQMRIFSHVGRSYDISTEDLKSSGRSAIVISSAKVDLQSFSFGRKGMHLPFEMTQFCGFRGIPNFVVFIEVWGFMRHIFLYNDIIEIPWVSSCWPVCQGCHRSYCYGSCKTHTESVFQVLASQRPLRLVLDPSLKVEITAEKAGIRKQQCHKHPCFIERSGSVRAAPWPSSLCVFQIQLAQPNLPRWRSRSKRLHQLRWTLGFGLMGFDLMVKRCVLYP